jgi:hypothetical protein
LSGEITLNNSPNPARFNESFSMCGDIRNAQKRRR